MRVAFISLHTSPAERPGTADAGGMNVVEYHQAFALAELGHRVDLITRRSDPGQADVVELSDRVRLLHLPAGPATKLAKSLIDAHIDELRGRDLACWCPLDQPCHADVLLELASP